MYLPVNLAFYWKTLLAVPGAESGFTDAGNKLFNDLFYDITSYYANIDITTCKFHEEHLYRVMTLRWFPQFSELRDYQKTYLEDQGFLIPDDPFLETFKMRTQGHSIAAIADSMYEPSFHLKRDISYTLKDGVLSFDFNIFEGEHAVQIINESYATPWGEIIPIESVNLIATEVALEESPFWNNFAALVYNKRIEDTETELEYRTKILSLTYMAYKGLTPKALNTTMNVLFSLPVTIHSFEKVQEITSTYLKTDKEKYTLDPNLGALRDDIRVGNTYPKFTALYDIITVVDASTDPEWVDQLVLPQWMYHSTIDAHKRMDLTTEIPLTFGSAPGNAEIRYDTPGMEPYADPDDPTSFKVKTITSYIWHAQLKNAISQIVLNLNKIGHKLPDFSFLEEVLPIWTSYLVTGKLNVSSELIPINYADTAGMSRVTSSMEMNLCKPGDILVASLNGVETGSGEIINVHYKDIVYKPLGGTFAIGGSLSVPTNDRVTGEITAYSPRFDHGSFEERSLLGIAAGEPSFRIGHLTLLNVEGFDPIFWEKDTCHTLTDASNFPPATFGSSLIDPYLSSGFSYKNSPSIQEGATVLTSDSPNPPVGSRPATEVSSVHPGLVLSSESLGFTYGYIPGAANDHTWTFREGFTNVIRIQFQAGEVSIDYVGTGTTNVFTLTGTYGVDTQVSLVCYVDAADNNIKWRLYTRDSSGTVQTGTWDTGISAGAPRYFDTLLMSAGTTSRETTKMLLDGTVHRGSF